MTEETERRPIPVARAILTWLILLVAALATAFWLERFGLPGETREIGVVGPWLGLLLALLVLDQRTRDSRSLMWVGLALLVVVATLMPHDVGAWPATAAYLAVTTAVLVIAVATTHPRLDGGRLRRIADWTGLWAPLDPAVARLTPISWRHAIRSWLVLWPLCHGLGAVYLWVADRDWRILALASGFAFLDAGLVGTQHRPRTRRWGACFGVSVSVVVFLFLISCGAFAQLSVGMTTVVSVLITSAGLAGIVAITYLPGRTVPVAEGDER